METKTVPKQKTLPLFTAPGEVPHPTPDGFQRMAEKLVSNLNYVAGKATPFAQKIWLLLFCLVYGGYCLHLLLQVFL